MIRVKGFLYRVVWSLKVLWDWDGDLNYWGLYGNDILILVILVGVGNHMKSDLGLNHLIGSTTKFGNEWCEWIIIISYWIIMS